MYWNDHEPPHFHATYQNFFAIFEVKSGRKMAGKFPKTGEKIVVEWAKQNNKELMEAWDMVRKKKIPKKIRGADK